MSASRLFGTFVVFHFVSGVPLPVWSSRTTQTSVCGISATRSYPPNPVFKTSATQRHVCMLFSIFFGGGKLLDRRNAFIQIAASEGKVIVKEDRQSLVALHSV